MGRKGEGVLVTSRELGEFLFLSTLFWSFLFYYFTLLLLLSRREGRGVGDSETIANFHIVLSPILPFLQSSGT